MSVSSFLEKLKQRVSPTPVDETGMWYQNDDVIVPSNKITMKGPNGEDDYFEKPILGVGMQSGKQVMMQPGEDYEFPEDKEVYETQMQLGGRINNVSPRGDVDFSVGNKNKLSGQVVGSINAPSLQMNSLTPRLAYSNKGFNANVSPGGFGAGYEGEKGYIDYNQSTAGKDTYRTASAGYNTERVNLNANATMRNNMLENAGIEGSYQVTPNLSLSGNYNINKGEQGTDKNYFAGFRYTKSFQEGGQKKESSRSLVGLIPQITPGVNDVMDFTDIIQGAASGDRTQMNQGIIGMASPGLAGKAVPTFLDYVTEKTLGKEVADSNQSKRENIVNMSSSDLQKLYAKYGPGGYDKWKAAGFPKLQMGGMSIPGVNGTVVASSNTSRLKKAYMQQAGYVKYVPPSQRPLTFRSDNPSTSDNTRVNTVMSNKPITPVAIPSKPVTRSKSNPSLNNRLAAMSEVEDRIYADNTAVYSIPPMNLTKKANYDVEEDYRQSVESGLAGRLLNVLPTPLASYIRGLADEDNTTADFTESQKQAAAYAIAKAEARKSKAGDEGYTGSFDYADYPAGYRDEQGVAHNPALSNLFNLPSLDGKTGKRLDNVTKYWGSAMMQPTLGKANFKKYNDEEYLIHDRYNFDSYNPNSKSIVDRAEKFANEWGVETETNLRVPVKYVEDARKQIAEEDAQPKVKQPEEQEKSTVKSTGEKAPANVSKPVVQKSKLQQSYEQAKPSFKKTLTTTTTQSKQTTPAKQAPSRNQINSEESKVQNYQKMLNSKYNAGLEADGAWGPKTQAAYEKYILKK
jgi:hypothetical protein